MRVAAIALMILMSVQAPAQLFPPLGQKRSKELSGYDKAARATTVHPTIVYVTADEGAQKVAEVTAGHEMVVVQRSGPWVKVFANTDTPDQDDPDHEPEIATDDVPTPSSGWVLDAGIVTPQTTNGAAILFGTAANFEDEAEQPHAPKGAAEAAHLLYRRVVEYFPDSQLTGEAAWRSADIRWQLQKAANSSLPSTKEQEAYLRPQLYEAELRKVIKMYPKSRYAALAAWDMLDNKLCGDWQGLPHCPEMEASLYMRYAEQWPESPRAAEAQYDAVYRSGVLVTMYGVEDDTKRVKAAVERTVSLAEDMHARFPDSDFTRRAESIAYRVQQGLSVYGSDRK